MAFHIDSKQLREKILTLRSFSTPLIWVDTEEIRRGIDVVAQAFLDANVTRKEAGKSTPEILEWDTDAGIHSYDWEWKPTKSGKQRPKGKAVPIFPGFDADGNPVLKPNTDDRVVFLRALLEGTKANTIVLVANLGEFLRTAQGDQTLHNSANTLLYKWTEGMIYNDPRAFAKDENVKESLKKKLVTIIAVGPKPIDGVLEESVKNNVMWVRLGRPTKEEHAEMVLREFAFLSPEEWAKTTERFEVDKKAAKEDVAAIAGGNLMGLTAYEAESAFYYSLKGSGGIDPAFLSSYRRELINSTAGLTLRDYDPMFDMNRVKGLDNAEEIIETLMAPDLPAEDRARSLLFVGPPGTGKTMLGRAFAQKLKVPFVSVEIEKMLGGLVGDSERNLNRALEVIDSIGPCVAFIDEADKQLAGTSDENSGGGGDLTKRMGGILLRWEQDRRSEAKVIKTANRLHNFSSEMLRRCDIKLMVDFPHIEDRKAIIDQYAADRNLDLDARLKKDLATKTRYWSGDEIKKLVARIRAFGNNPDGILRAFEYVRPVCITHRQDIAKIRKEGREIGVLASMEDVDKEDNSEIPTWSALPKDE